MKKIYWQTIHKIVSHHSFRSCYSFLFQFIYFFPKFINYYEKALILVSHFIFLTYIPNSPFHAICISKEKKANSKSKVKKET